MQWEAQAIFQKENQATISPWDHPQPFLTLKIHSIAFISHVQIIPLLLCRFPPFGYEVLVRCYLDWSFSTVRRDRCGWIQGKIPGVFITAPFQQLSIVTGSQHPAFSSWRMSPLPEVSQSPERRFAQLSHRYVWHPAVSRVWIRMEVTLLKS